MRKAAFFVTLLFISNLFMPVAALFAAAPSNEHFTGLIITWQEEKESENSLWLRTKEVKRDIWTRWYKIEADNDHDEKEGSASSEYNETLFSSNLSSEYEYKIEGEGYGIHDIKIEKILSVREGRGALVAGLTIPTGFHIISRAEWGADEDITFEKDRPAAATNGNGEFTDSNERSAIEEEDPDIARVVEKDSNNKTYVWPLQYAKDIKFIVVHHTASVVNLDNPKLALQNIEYYHAVKRGWGDIGYNYVIDTKGNIYEGRKGGDKIIGGHARPVNKVSIGIAVLGNYQANEAPPEVLTALMALIQQKAKQHKIDIDGKTKYKDTVYSNVHGHGDNTPTQCPGIFLKQTFDGLKKILVARQGVNKNIKNRKFVDVDERSIIKVKPGVNKKITLNLKNTSKSLWSKRTFIEVVGKSADAGTSQVLAKLENSVKPNATGAFSIILPAQLTPGLRLLEAKLVINGSVRTTPNVLIPYLVEKPVLTYEVIERKDPPTSMKPGETFTASLTLKNTGSFAWKKTGPNPVRVGTFTPPDRKSSFFNKRSRVSTLVQNEVKPGETGKFLLRLKAPTSSGFYEEDFKLVMENIGWFTSDPIQWKISIKGTEKPLRVALSFDKTEAVFKSPNGLKLYQNKTLTREFEATEKVTVNALSNGTYQLHYGDNKTLNIAKPPRFKDKKGAPVTIDNFEHRPAWNLSLNDNIYRGILEVQRVDSKFTVINELPLEDYLKGIGEVSNGDPKEKIKTIIILARSYAKYYRDNARKFPGKPYDLDDDPDHTQKYIGYGFELRAADIVQAVKDTNGQIVTYQGKPVLTPYFNQSDGKTRSALEVWGMTDRPYLKSVPDTFCGTTELKGHGVGVSGCGATALAKQGKTAEEIIKYYYTGVEISR